LLDDAIKESLLDSTTSESSQRRRSSINNVCRPSKESLVDSMPPFSETRRPSKDSFDRGIQKILKRLERAHSFSPSPQRRPSKDGLEASTLSGTEEAVHFSRRPKSQSCPRPKNAEEQRRPKTSELLLRQKSQTVYGRMSMNARYREPLQPPSMSARGGKEDPEDDPALSELWDPAEAHEVGSQDAQSEVWQPESSVAPAA
jgi:hypothetical protein